MAEGRLPRRTFVKHARDLRNVFGFEFLAQLNSFDQGRRRFGVTSQGVEEGGKEVTLMLLPKLRVLLRFSHVFAGLAQEHAIESR